MMDTKTMNDTRRNKYQSRISGEYANAQAKENEKRIINELEKNLPEDLFIEGEKPKDFVESFIREYLNYLVYKFLGIKAYRFKDIKSGHYMLKDLEQRSLMKGKDLAENFAQWFDELYLGKYDLIPFFKVLLKYSYDSSIAIELIIPTTSQC